MKFLVFCTPLIKNLERLIQFSSVTQSCPTLCDPMDCSTPGFPVHHQLQELAQTHVHWVSDATQPSHPLSSHSPPALNLSQHQGLFKWVSSSHQVAKILEWIAIPFSISSVQSLSRVRLCDPMNSSMPGLSVHHQLPEFTQTHVHWVSDAIQPSHPLSSPSPPTFNLYQHQGLFQWVFASGGQSVGVSASTSVLPKNTQDWSPLGWTDWISWQAKGLSRVFPNTTVQKHQLFNAQLSL